TALREIRRVLRAHGSLIVTDWCNDFFSIRLTDLILRCFNQAHVRSYSIKGIKHLLEENDFSIINIDRYRISPWWGMMTIQATV
ncbi:MAG: class I SAM-dependent methyltransferase, partial [Candidatus Saccharimonadales bacterium]